MKVSELIKSAGFTPGTKNDGEVKTNHFILGIQTETSQTKEVDYTVAGPHVEALGQSIESETEDANYMYEGKSTSRTSAQRKFEVSGKPPWLAMPSKIGLAAIRLSMAPART